MAIVRWQPADDFASLQTDVNRLFNSFFDRESRGTGTRSWVPPMDLVETEDQYVLTADLPGLSEEDVKIELEDRVLWISGERKIEHEIKGENYYRLERGAGSFSRTVSLPEGVDPQKVKARFENGVLEVRIDKPEERKPQRISIQLGDSPAQIEGRESGERRAA